MFSVRSHALALAIKAHDGQVRDYTLEPYVLHPIRVTEIIATLGADELTQVIALLHDVFEDCPQIDRAEVRAIFGDYVYDGVLALTNVDHSYGNRQKRKIADRDRIAAAGAWIQAIKIADMIDNIPSIIKYDPKFAKVYVAEKSDMLLHLTKARESFLQLWQTADNLLRSKGGD